MNLKPNDKLISKFLENQNLLIHQKSHKLIDKPFVYLRIYDCLFYKSVECKIVCH